MLDLACQAAQAWTAAWRQLLGHALHQLELLKSLKLLVIVLELQLLELLTVQTLQLRVPCTCRPVSCTCYTHTQLYRPRQHHFTSNEKRLQGTDQTVLRG